MSHVLKLALTTMHTYLVSRFLALALFSSLIAAVPWSVVAAAVPPTSQALPTVVTVDATSPGSPLPHFWEAMFGSGRAILELRSEYRKDLVAVHSVTGFKYLRFHGIFDKGVGLVYRSKDGKIAYDFTYVDKIYDNLLKHGVMPYVELSFMPPVLSSEPSFRSPYGFSYDPNAAPPNNYHEWDSMIRAFARHLIDRYGIDEVSKWYFEVWNEPNNEFWGGRPKQATYFKLYDNTARALKSVNAHLRVGGPSTGGGLWIGAFLLHVKKAHVPVDFISTHTYANESPGSLKNGVCNVVMRVHDEILKSPFPHMPLIISEYNASDTNVSSITDSDFMGPWIANTLRECAGAHVHMMSYWTFSDVFEEQGVPHTPFYGGFGLIAQDRIAKPAFNTFKILHLLGHTRLATKSASVLVTRRANGDLVLALWNYAPPPRVAGVPVVTHGRVRSRDFALRFLHVRDDARVTIWRVDRRHGDPMPLFYQMGEPHAPTRTQIRELRRAGKEPQPEVTRLHGRRLNVRVPVRGLAVVVVHVKQ